MSDPQPSNLQTIKIGSQSIQLVTYDENKAQLSLVSSPPLPDDEMEAITKLVELWLFKFEVTTESISVGNGIRLITADPSYQKNADNKLMFDRAVEILNELRKNVETRDIHMADEALAMSQEIVEQEFVKTIAELETLPIHAKFVEGDDEPSTQVGGVARRSPVRGLNHDYIEALVLKELSGKIDHNFISSKKPVEYRAWHIAARVMQACGRGMSRPASVRGTVEDPLYLIISDEINGIPPNAMTHANRKAATQAIFEAVEQLYLEFGGRGAADRAK